VWNIAWRWGRARIGLDDTRKCPKREPSAPHHPAPLIPLLDYSLPADAVTSGGGRITWLNGIGGKPSNAIRRLYRASADALVHYPLARTGGGIVL
jgi:hypothetical protein